MGSLLLEKIESIKILSFNKLCLSELNSLLTIQNSQLNITF